MSERRFVIDVVENYHSMAPINIVTESELLKRCGAIRKPEFLTGERAIDILVNGEKKEVE